MLAARCAAATLALAAASMPVSAHASEPIPWQDAHDHVSRRVVVEGIVAATRRIDAGCVLAFTDEEPPAFTVKLVMPLFTRGPDRPEEYYRGKRVRVTGVVRQLSGEPPEIIVRNPAAITVIAPADAGGPPLTGGLTAPGAATLESTARPEEPGRLHSSAIPDGGGERGLTKAEAVPQEPVTARCEMAQERWRSVRTRIEGTLASMSDCVRAARYRCRDEAEALYAAMAELAATEGAIEASCP